MQDDPDGFLTISLLAFVEIAQKQGGWPDSEAVKQLAYKNFKERKK